MDGIVTAASLLFFLLTGLIIGIIALNAGHWFSFSREEESKRMPYECGDDSIGQARRGYIPVNYYSFALAFILFDIEIIFLMPWVLVFYSGGWPTLIAVSVFLLILLFGLWFGFASGALRWD